MLEENVARKLWYKPRKKALTSARCIKSTNTLETLAHGFNPKADQSFRILLTDVGGFIAITKRGHKWRQDDENRELRASKSDRSRNICNSGGLGERRAERSARPRWPLRSNTPARTRAPGAARRTPCRRSRGRAPRTARR